MYKTLLALMVIISSTLLQADFTYKSGDIVLSKNKDKLSDLISLANLSFFSHSGTILIQDNKVKIIHIRYNENAKDLMITDIKEYLAESMYYSVYRPISPTNAKELTKSFSSLYKTTVNFDKDFNDEVDNNDYYCTELTFYLYNSSNNKKLPKEKMRYMMYSFIPLDIFGKKDYFKLLYETDKKQNLPPNK